MKKNKNRNRKTVAPTIGLYLACCVEADRNEGICDAFCNHIENTFANRLIVWQ